LEIENNVLLTAENYRLWAAQCEFTFSVHGPPSHGVLNIVLGRDLNPAESVQTPSESEVGDAEIASVITAAQHRSITK
jgi:hypothetical protein